MTGQSGDPTDGGDAGEHGHAAATWLERFESVPEPVARSQWLVPLLTLGAGAACAAGWGFAKGADGVVAGVVAGILVVAFFAGSPLPLTLTQGSGTQGSVGSPALGLLVLVSNYVFRLTAALLVLAVASRAGLDRRAIGISVIICALVRVNAQVVLLRRFST